MAWWNDVDTVSALAAYDGAHAGGGQFTDQVSSNHLTYGSYGAVGKEQYKLQSITGVSSPGPWALAAPITLPSSWSVAVAMKVSPQAKILSNASNHSVLWYSGGYFHTRGGSLIQTFTHSALEWFFYVHTFDSSTSTSKFYLDGILRRTLLTPPPQLPVTVSHVGDVVDPTSSFGLTESLGGLGVFTGVLTNDQIVKMEADFRRENAPIIADVISLKLTEGSMGSVSGKILDDQFAPFGQLSGIPLVMAHSKVYESEGRVISGVITEGGQPVSRVVRLHETNSGIFVAQTFSAANGVYSFNSLPKGVEYYVVSFDRNGIANMVGKDRVKT